VDKSKLCTRWQVYPVGSEEATVVCYGNEACCNFVGLEPYMDNWDDSFVLTHGAHDSGYNNLISAQVIYGDIDNAEIYYSSWAELSARFISEFIAFEDVCAETCLLPSGLDSTSYKLVFEISSGVLNIGKISYVAKNLTQAVEVKEFEFNPDIKNARNELVEYDIEFEDADTKRIKKSEQIRKPKGMVIAPAPGLSIEEGKYNIKVKPREHPIKSIVVHDVDISSNITEFIDIDDVPEFGGYVEVYAIDPTRFNFTEATVTVTAKGNALYKCKDWDFTTQTCHGEWVFLQSITPGQNYTFTLTPEDPAFAEAPSACTGEWTNCANAQTDDANTAGLTGGTTDRYGNWSGFNLNIPDGSIINSIKVKTKHHANHGSNILNFQLWDHTNQQFLTGHALTGTMTQCTEEVIDATGDKSWTSDDINNINVAYYNTGGGGRPNDRQWHICYIEINVTYTEVDETPPGAITDLQNMSAGTAWIYWNWTNPSDADFSEAIIYINGSNAVNTSNNFYNATGLDCEAEYTITVNTKDTSGNVNDTDISSTANTLTCPDTTPPDITGVSAENVTYESAVIVWQTNNEASNSSLNYGISLSLGTTAANSSFVNDHSIALTNLTNSTLYYFNVTSCDSTGNCNTSGYYNFTTEELEVELNETVEDSEGKPINTTIEVIDEIEHEVKYNQTGKTHSFKVRKDRIYTINIKPVDHIVKQIEFVNISIKKQNGELVDIEQANESQDFLFSVNPLINGTNITITADGTSLPNGTDGYRILKKCADWDFTTNTCSGSWAPYAALKSGGTYEFIISANDPGFQEGVSSCVAEQKSTQGSWDVACDGSYPGACGDGGDLLSCNDGNVEQHDYNKDAYAGVKIQQYNTSITNCGSITSVYVCYEWWQNGGDPTACDISVDNDGDASWAAATTGCPGTTADPGVACTDVTGLEDWTCSNFFGESGTRAEVKSEITRTSAGAPDIATWDALYFNVTYAIDTPPSSVTSLANQSAGYTWIYWNWTNPSDSDFNHTEVWINGTFYANVSASDNFYNATGLSPDSWYEIQTRTADNNGNINTTWVNDSAKTLDVEVLVNETVEDAQGNPVNVTIEVIDETNGTIGYNQTGNGHSFNMRKDRTYTIRVKPINHKIKQIEFRNVSSTADLSQIVDIDDPADNQGWGELYAVNPFIGNASNNDTYTVTATASAGSNILYKCADWNFTNQSCKGSWTGWQRITAGQEYNATFVVGDPGLAEGSGVFFEGFEGTGYENTGWTVVGGGAWNPDDKDEYAGADALSTKATGGLAWDEIDISTRNYTNIVFSLYYKTEGTFGAGEYIAADYWNGTAWVNVLNTSNVGTYTLDNNSLGSDADNNPNFKIRLACNNDAPSKYCDWDNVQVTGTFTPDYPPYWSNNQTSIAGTYSPTTQSYFNITWQDAYSVSTVWLESNYSGTPKNYSVNEIATNVYSYSTILPAGTHYWKSYANDSADQWNETGKWVFTIAKAATTTTLYINGSTDDFRQNVTFDANITCVLSISSSINITQNGTQIDYGASPLQNISTYSAIGDYLINCSYTDQNYSDSSDSSVIQAVDEIAPTTTQIYPPANYWNDISDPYSITFNCSATDNYDLTNISLYITNNQNTSFALNKTTSVSGTSSSADWALSLSNGNYTWNCLAYDASGLYDWGENRTVLINYTAPPVTLNITSITITPDDDGATPGAQINPLEDSNVSVNLVANITNSSAMDACKIRIWNGSGSYTVPTLAIVTGEIQALAGGQTICNASWNMSYWRNPGTWSLSVDVNQTDSSSAQKNSSYYYNVLTSHLVNVSYVNFSGLPGQTINSSTAYPLSIRNTGNKAINISIRGTDFVGVQYPSYNFSIGNATYSDTELGSYTSITTVYVQITELDELAPASTAYLYFRGTIPVGTKSQAYQNAISIKSD
ncbi:Ig-like domain-containing protein, partial [Candidatus Woesearchaeota archaeon]|nr:Ig-like domain-containing protein [Candidatus Woesearchaeota archaeon]